ncbi:GspH/FimT family pseudopilin [Ectopseudomonas mendocina]|uniref:GspH/FimT family pseudopilin n=1 Tax=Ectopseudomonas mendocina TaxID=300 RepID=UPI003F05B2D0
MQSSRGFTLIELMVVLAIIVIAAAVAVPSYNSSVEAGRKTSAVNNLVGALQFARSEAITRRSDGVKVCASAGGSTCSGSNWSAGGVVLDGSTLLRSIPAAPDVTITGNTITFNSDGTTTASTIAVGDKVISVNIVGAAKIQ